MSGVFPGQVKTLTDPHLCILSAAVAVQNVLPPSALALSFLKASNGGQSSDYSSSLPSTPVISHKDIGRTLRGEKSDGAGPGSVRGVRRRTPRFAVSAVFTFLH